MKSLLCPVITTLGYKRRQDIIDSISPYLKPNDTILDIGSGIGDVAHKLQSMKFRITPVDVQDLSCFEDVIPTLYDGKKLPFASNSFDVSLLLTVLHHTPDPRLVVSEAKRVAKRIVVMEDLVESSIQKGLTFTMDSITNFEFIGHPHTNKSQKEWEKLFALLKLKIIDKKTHSFWNYFLSGTFYLTK